MVYGMLLAIALLSILAWDSFYYDFRNYWPDEDWREHALMALAVPMSCIGAGLILWALVEILP